MKLSIVTIIICGFALKSGVAEEVHFTSYDMDTTVSFEVPSDFKKDTKSKELVWNNVPKRGSDGKFPASRGLFILVIVPTKTPELIKHYQKALAEPDKGYVVEPFFDKQFDDGRRQYAYIMKGGYYRYAILMEQFYPIKEGTAVLTYQKNLGPVSKTQRRMEMQSVPQDVQEAFKSFKEVEKSTSETLVNKSNQ